MQCIAVVTLHPVLSDRILPLLGQSGIHFEISGTLTFVCSLKYVLC